MPRILIVEDERIVAKDIQLSVESSGFAVTGIATSAQEALDRVRADRPDLVLMDIMLGGREDGIAAARRLRDEFLLPVVYLTAYADDATFARARDTAPYGYIIKPFDDRDLRFTIEMALEKHAMQRQLEDREQRYRDLFEHLPSMYFVMDAGGIVRAVNPAAVEQLGYPEAELVGHEVLKVFHPDDQAAVRASFAHCLDHPGRPFEWEFRKITSDGTVIWVQEHVRVVVREGDGTRVHVICDDITARKQAEAQTARHRAAMDASMDGMALADADGRFVYVNPALVQMYGMADEQALLGDSFGRLTGGEPDRLAREILPLLQALGSWRGETAGVREDGSAFPQELSLSRLPDGGTICVARDISIRRELEEQVRQAQKMEAVGRLAGGVAHDFNNLLTSVLGYAKLLRSQLPEDSPARRDVREVIHAGERAAGLTRQLLAVSRRQMVQVRRIDANEVIRGMESLLVSTLGENTSVEFDLSESPGTIEADAGQLEQILLNLAVNSRDAMPSGGAFRVATRHRRHDHAFYRRHPDYLAPASVEIEVRDSGTGIPPAIQDQIFEPFFTTKERGKGTGLGLAMVYGITTQFHGVIELDSAEGRGTAFRLCFPAADGLPETEKPADESRQRRGSETILLVEDEHAVRRFVARVLRGLGYQVIEAANAGEALLLSEKRGQEPLDLLLTDVIMPQVSGKELADRLHAMRPGLRTAFMSGFTAESLTGHGVGDLGPHFLAKPFTPEQLSALLRQIFDDPQDRGAG